MILTELINYFGSPDKMEEAVVQLLEKECPKFANKRYIRIITFLDEKYAPLIIDLSEGIKHPEFECYQLKISDIQKRENKSYLEAILSHNILTFEKELAINYLKCPNKTSNYKFPGMF